MNEPEPGGTRRGLGAVASGDAPTASGLLAGLGGVRGIVESVLPGALFLVVYTITKEPLLSAVAPLVVAAVLLVVRLVQRGPVGGAVFGLVLMGISAAIVMSTGRASDNFVVGLWINAAYLAAILISIAATWPVVGVLVGVFSGSATAWRADRATRRAAYASTWLWAALFAVRLAVEVPLYLADQPEALAIAKLVLGVPCYALCLWATWVLYRRAFASATH